MANKVQLKKSSVASRVPLTTDIDYGELALNYTDGKLYYKKSDGTTIDHFPSVSQTVSPSGSYANPSWITSLDSSKLTGTIDNARLNGGTYSINISGNASSASTLQTARTINGISFNGSSNIKVTDWFHSDRDFASGTLVTTDIIYSQTNGDPWVIEIRGNSYGDIVPYDIQYQGYIYSDTIINHGGVSNGTNISGLVAINVGGNLCFWWPRQSYWNGFNVRVYVPHATYPVNRVTSITSTAKPTSTKEVGLSANIRQSLHTGNYSSYAQPTLVSGTNIKTVNGNSLLGSGNITVTSSTANTLDLSGHTISNSAWAGGGGYHGYTYNGGNFRFGFSSTGGVVDVYADGNFYATDSSHLVLHAGNWTNYIQQTYAGWDSNPGKDANSVVGGSWARSYFTYSNNAPATGPFVHFPAGGYDLQLNATYSNSENLYFRSRNGDNGSFNSWRRVLVQDAWQEGKYFSSGGHIYGNVFYDANNTGYYCDPNGDSRFNRLLADRGLGWSTSHHCIGANIGTAIPHWNTAQLEIRNTDAGNVGIGFHRSGYTSVGLYHDGGDQIRVTGSFLAASNITAYSDEKLKKDWSFVAPDFVERLANILSGTYTRVDTDQRHAGCSAQDWQKLLPEVVLTDNTGTLSLAYGNAALVSSVELAKRVVSQEARIKRLESLIEKLI